ncbi:MAG TPA: ATP-binding protein, partial [Bacteroidia bacterium]
MKKTNPSKPKTETAKTPSFTAEQAKWVVEATSSNVFHALRYYAIINNEVPSVRNYYPYQAEAIALLHELKETFQAKVIHSTYNDPLNTIHTLLNYTVRFPNPRYLLQAPTITEYDKSDYAPNTLFNIHSPYNKIYLASFQLLFPSDDSGKRDMEFEQKLHTLLFMHIPQRAAEKPFIWMIEAGSNGWEMNSHALVDDFEIEDLDINYGSGFTDFHNDLMERFEDETKGLALFHGEPGTGKTYYIRHLLKEMTDSDKNVVYMPPNMVDHLTEPGFISFLMKQLTEWADDGNYCVLLIEDAEPLLAKRQEGIR